jgi:hypothetical protein
VSDGPSCCFFSGLAIRTRLLVVPVVTDVLDLKYELLQLERRVRQLPVALETDSSGSGAPVCDGDGGFTAVRSQIMHILSFQIMDNGHRLLWLGGGGSPRIFGKNQN